MSNTLSIIFTVLSVACIRCPGQAVDGLSGDGPPNDHAHPHWIWCSEDRSETEPVWFERSFTTQRRVVSATLRCASESASVTLWVDDKMIAVMEPYDPLLTIHVTDSLRIGDHRLGVSAERVDGPSAFFVQLDIEFDNGDHKTIVSDASWKAGVDSQRAKVVRFGPVGRQLLIPKAQRVGITAVDNYEQWKQALGTDQGTNPASFMVAPGFEIRLVRSARPDEDSWVSMVFDPLGRLVIAKENQGLLRMTLSEDGSEVTRTEVIDDTLKECRGLIFSGNDLFANANNSKGLYRLRRIDDDRFETPELVHASSGGVGHGRNDLAVGPDAMIYSIHGDSVDIQNRVSDYTSPFRDARRGKKTSEGHLLRIDPASGKVEVLAAGLRNPFGIDFNRNGDLFTYDADAEYDMGSPWYRPTRVNHLVIGGDYGWRGVTKSWPSYYPDHADNARPNLDLGKGSPTAVKFGTRSNFPARYHDSLFILDWAYGRIIAVHSTPRGSSYLMAAETFLKGRPLNVTDLDFSPSGSMYLVTGGRKTLSALYQVRHVGDRSTRSATETRQQSARRTFSAKSRKLRRDLESQLQGELTKEAIDRAWQHLSDQDPWIAQAATHLIEQYPVAQWRARALSEPERLGALRALLSLARSGDPELRPATIARLNEIGIGSAPRSQKLIALQAYSLCLSPEIVEADGELMSATRTQLAAMYPDRSYVVNRSLSELMVRINAPDVVAKTILLLNSTTNQTEQMHYLYVLRGVQDRWSMADRVSYFTALQQSKYYLAGAGMSDFIKRIRDESVSTLSESERKSLRSIIDEVSSDGADRLPDEKVAPRPFVKKWTVDGVLERAGDHPTRSRQRGSEMFAAAACIQCHRIGRRGIPVGPDLTAVSSRFSRRDLLTSIIDPSKVIAENYRSVQILTSDGATYVGQAVFGGDYRSPLLRLATDPTNPLETIEIEKSEIEIQQTSPVSWMPVGLVDTLTRDEILDLLAYIESAGSGSPR